MMHDPKSGTGISFWRAGWINVLPKALRDSCLFMFHKGNVVSFMKFNKSGGLSASAGAAAVNPRRKAAPGEQSELEHECERTGTGWRQPRTRATGRTATKQR